MLDKVAGIIIGTGIGVGVMGLATVRVRSDSGRGIAAGVLLVVLGFALITIKKIKEENDQNK